jgi:hypothetical protein
MLLRLLKEEEAKERALDEQLHREGLRTPPEGAEPRSPR